MKTTIDIKISDMKYSPLPNPQLSDVSDSQIGGFKSIKIIRYNESKIFALFPTSKTRSAFCNI